MSKFDDKLAKKLGLLKSEMDVLRKLKNPNMIQDFVRNLDANFEEQGETLMSPRKVLATKKCHCMEGALLSSLALWLIGFKPLILDLKTKKHDFDHVISVFRVKGLWGAISKTNHATLRYRDPIYKNIRELVMSYFHEYTLDSGEKTLLSYSNPVDLSLQNHKWVTEEDDLWYLSELLDQQKHRKIVPRGLKLRKADKIEIEAGEITEYKRNS